jgi:tRNA pseudouridine55 synthase
VAKRGRATSSLDGFFVADKAAGMTSHDVVAIVRRQLGERRVGHAGTLDPDATGVLVVAVGRSTRLMRFVTGADKAYRAEVVLGTATSTLDASGEVTGRFDMGEMNLDQVRSAALGLTGKIDQVPPMVSAIKIDGQRLYELARQGEEVERNARAIEVTRFDVAPTPDPLVFVVEVECSSGTYVRSLAADLGTALGGGAHLRNLLRIRVGSFGVDAALDAKLVTAADLRPPVELLAGMDRITVDASSATAIGYGRSLDPSSVGAEGGGPFALIGSAGELLAVYERDAREQLRPIVVHVAAATGSGDLARPDGE